MAGTQDDGELALSEDESLPWLESDEQDDEGGFDTAQIVAFALGLLLITALLVVGGLWWWNNRGSGDAPVADGSTIAAPEEPYKTRPDDPGGKEFAGTGDVAPGVGEGKTREGRLKEGEASGSKITDTARPSIATRSTNEGSGESSGETTNEKITETAGVAVQVGAYSSRADAQTGWATLRGQTDVLNGVRHRIVKGQADIGTVYRLQALAGDLAGARSLCSRLKDDGVACQVKN